jgi:hypothetical protein
VKQTFFVTSLIPSKYQANRISCFTPFATRSLFYTDSITSGYPGRVLEIRLSGAKVALRSVGTWFDSLIDE